MHTSRLQKAAFDPGNLAVFGMETVAIPLSWSGVQEQMFLFYTELSNLFAMAVCLAVALCQLRALCTGARCRLGPAPSSMSSPAADADLFDGGVCAGPHVWPRRPFVMLLTSSMLYNHFLNPVLAFLSFTLLERAPALPRRTVRYAWCLRCCTAVWCWPPTLPKCIKDPIRSCMFTSSRCGSRRCGW